MVDQLSLRLEPVLPRLPSGLRPMQPRPADGPFDSPHHLFEPNWGGQRVLAFLERVGPSGRHLQLVDEDGRDLAPLLPELASLPARIARSSAVLDGELVVVDRHGRADHAALQTRLRGPGLTIGRPVALLAFDLLALDGRLLLAMPLERRRRLLADVLRPGDEVVAVPAIAAEGRALHDAVVAQGIAGVMARERRSPYLPGTRSGLWLFVERAAVSGEPLEVVPKEVPEEPAAEGPGAVLALIRRLPLDD
jgi:bifunctional non-homologous end joining protein LigD/DNA ligase-1